MEKIRRFAQALLLVLIFLSTALWGESPLGGDMRAQAAPGLASSEQHTWWLMSWRTEEILCVIPIDHPGTPTPQDIATRCGQDLAYQWLNTPPCRVGKKGIQSTRDCEGVYLHLISTKSEATAPGIGSQPAALASSPAGIGSSDPAKQASAPGNAPASVPRRSAIFEIATTQAYTPTIDTCALIWQSTPFEPKPTWLQTPTDGALLSSDEPFYYLAGRLIAHGVVDASDCPGGGLQPNGYANECGLKKAEPQARFWQNQFDPEIMSVATSLGVPAQLMKNLFAQESQFWPGTFRVPYEYGFGQITDQGVDVLFMWNPVFYQAFCPLVLSRETCDAGYMKLDPESRALLRGALSSQADADCPECPTGIDLEKANDSITLFANVLIANCTQVGQVVIAVTDYIPGSVASYEDLWRFTLANYHAGPGCVTYGLYNAWIETRSLTWEAFTENLTGPCSGVIKYVNNIAQ